MHAAESTHFYKRDGSPCYTVTAKAGHERPTNVADARKLGLVPSVTTILKCADRPGLNRWMLEQMLHAALTLPRGPTEPEAQWIERVWADSRETGNKAAERGTAIHAAIQQAFEGAYEFSPEMNLHISGAEQALEGWTADLGSMKWEAERSFAHPLGFGGKVDASAVEGDGFIYATGFVADFKTKEFSDPATLKTWDEHAMQLAAYRNGLGLAKARCAICYVSVTHPGLSRLIEIPEEELQRGWEMFRALLSFWIAKNKYNPAFTLEKQAA